MTLLEEYARGVEQGWTDDELYRLIVKNASRWFHNAGEPERRQMLQQAPPLTGTAWDALMAAVIEHAAETHGYARPRWVDDNERFVDGAVNMLPELTAADTLRCPAAFLRHGTLIDPESLSSRNGEEFDW